MEMQETPAARRRHIHGETGEGLPEATPAQEAGELAAPPEGGGGAQQGRACQVDLATVVHRRARI